MTFDTVGMDTPVCWAMNEIVVELPRRRRVEIGAWEVMCGLV
jgi:hypothetical protein